MVNLNYRIHVNYINDCTCFTKTFYEHLKSLKLTLECFEQNSLKLKISKSKFRYIEQNVLGNIISGDRIRSRNKELIIMKLIF